MKNKINYTNEDLGKNVKVIEDFLPPPADLILKKDTNLNQASALNVQIDADIAQFFKTPEAINHALRSLLQALSKSQMSV